MFSKHDAQPFLDWENIADGELFCYGPEFTPLPQAKLVTAGPLSPAEEFPIRSLVVVLVTHHPGFLLVVRIPLRQVFIPAAAKRERNNSMT